MSRAVPGLRDLEASGLADWSSQNPASLRARYDVAPRDLVVVGPGEALPLGVAGLFLVRLGEPDPVRLSSAQVSGHRLWADRRHIVVVGRQGRSYHASWDPAQATAGPWAVHDLPDSADVAAIWGSDPDDLLAVGRGGLVLRFDGTSWSAVKSPTRADLLSVDGDGAASRSLGDRPRPRAARSRRDLPADPNAPHPEFLR